MIFDDFLRSPILYIAALCSVSVQILHKNSGNISISNNSKMLQAITTKLGHNHHDQLPFMSHDLEGSKGHAGVTGVKSVILL